MFQTSKLISFLFFLFTLVIATCQENTTLSELVNEEIEIVKQKSKAFPSQTQLSIGIIKNGQVSFVGLKNIDGKIIGVQNHKNVFEIGSISKVFTATLLANFVHQDRVSLADNINDYIDFALYDNTQISLLELANHTSGLPRLPSNLNPYELPGNPYKNYSEKKLQDYMSNEMIRSQEGIGTYSYSNLGMGMLGYILTRLSGESYETLVQKHIFSKYKMNQSTTDRTRVEHVLIKGREVNGSEAQNYDLAAMVGAGGVLSSVEDLSLFVKAHLNLENLELALTRKSTHEVDHISDVGLAWEIIKRKSGDIWYRHNGGTGGYRSTMILDVEHRNGLILLSNISAFSHHSNTIYDISFDLMKSINKS